VDPDLGIQAFGGLWRRGCPSPTCRFQLGAYEFREPLSQSRTVKAVGKIL
jgi:hypothetical protein